MVPKTTVILHSDQENNQLAEQFKLTVRSILSQINRDFDVIFLGKTDTETRDSLQKNKIKIAEYYKIGRIYDPVYEVIRHSGGTDHAINQDVIDRNDEAKDDMRKEIILRRIAFNTA
ncbi:MAG: hypothetical protein IIB05_09040 [Bacteroidetes bacterium]|nr:hypothetical protein [Bacteroidota bacterium]